MLYLCRSVNTLLGIFDSDIDDARITNPGHFRNIPRASDGGLRILAGDPPRPANVLVSSAVGKPPRDLIDPGARGLHEIAYYGGLRMCTEDLGSESGDGGMEAEEMAVTLDWTRSPPGRRMAEARNRPRSAPAPPPPLSWLAEGRRRFMRAVREGGRIRLMEVQIERPLEVLRASREGGRLRLDFIGRPDSDDIVESGDEEATGAAEIADEEEGEKEKLIGTAEVDESEEIRSPAMPVEMVVMPSRSEDWRCQDRVSGNSVPKWWSHRPAMTA